jgi:hypothetical protein
MADAIARLRGERTGRLNGTLRDAHAPIVDATVQIFDENGAMTGIAAVRADGTYAIDLVPGRYRAAPSAPGRSPVSATAADELFGLASGTSKLLSFVMSARAVLSWHITGEDGQATPTKLTVAGVDGTPDPDFGPNFQAAGAENYVLSATGTGEVPILPGRYRVVASRGPEMETVERAIHATAGNRSLVAGQLVRSVKTPGFISTDLHQHASASSDSGVTLADRVLSNAAEGVEVLVATDHNVITDYTHAIASVALQREVVSVLGTEATTHGAGHFNALPLRIEAADPRRGLRELEGMSPRAIFDRLRGLGPPGITPYVQVNHPRAGPTMGYFDIMGLDSSTGVASKRPFASDFDGLEVVSFGRDEETRTILSDWFALLRKGLRVTAAGGSDTHAISYREVGWPRTYVCVDDDDPAHFDLKRFTESLRAGCATVSGGPFVTLRSGGVAMGGTVRALKGRFAITVDVQAPTWVATDRLVLYVDGVQHSTTTIDARDVHRLHRDFMLECKADCFVVAVVDSAKDMSPIVSKRFDIHPRPIAVTNPIFVDVDGDGLFRPIHQQEGARP